MKKQFISLTVIITILGIIAVSATWYFMDKKLKDQKLEYDKKISEIQEKIKDNEQEDENSDWLLYENDYFSIKYLKDWEYKEYKSGQEYFMVAFGENKSYFPAEQSDQMIGININISNEDWLNNSYKQSDNIKVTEEKIGKLSATKYLLLPGRDNDMYDESKITYYVIKSGNKYLIISNFEDYQTDIFEEMLETIEIK